MPSSFAAAPIRRSAGEPTATEFCASRAKVCFAPSFCQPANAFAQRDDGYDGHERLGEDDELGAVPRGVGGDLLEAVERALEVEHDRLGLHAGDLHGSVHEPGGYARDMGKVYSEIDEQLAAWIERQHLFFVATAPLADGRPRQRVAEGRPALVPDPRADARSRTSTSSAAARRRSRTCGRTAASS